MQENNVQSYRSRRKGHKIQEASFVLLSIARASGRLSSDDTFRPEDIRKRPFDGLSLGSARAATYFYLTEERGRDQAQ